MSSPTENAQTRQEWRALGFFYERDEVTRRWRLVGSKAGLARFCRLLRDYVADPRNVPVSEHEHHGPYLSLEIMTWTEATLDGHAISGRLEDLSRLASMVEARVATASAGESFRLGAEYAPAGDWDLEVEVAGDGFDPASADPSCIDPPSP
jgi:hypothetical protein